jgi:hypothetical protein
MHQTRIQPTSATTFLVGIECECGSGVTRNMETKERGFKHEVKLGGKDVDLECECHKRYRIHPQTNHFHVFTISS